MNTRNDALEDAAKVCDGIADALKLPAAHGAQLCAKDIRALKTKPDPQAGTEYAQIMEGLMLR